MDIRSLSKETIERLELEISVAIKGAKDEKVTTAISKEAYAYLKEIMENLTPVNVER